MACQLCPASCQSCALISGVVGCTSCPTGANINRVNAPVSNQCPCINGYAEANPIAIQCQQCHISCATCSGSANNNCLTCPVGAFRTLTPVAGGNICQCNYGYI